MLDNATAEKEKYMKKLKRKMESWREVILPLNSILLWEKSWHPGLILCVTTTIFLTIWVLEPAFLTLMSLTLLIVAVVDYFVPILTSRFISSNNWTGQKEKKLEEICQRLSSLIFRIQNSWNSLLNARTNWPTLYYGSIGICLTLLAWLGNSVNNLFLIYICVNAMLLTPGLKHKKRVQTAIKSLYNYAVHRKTS